jgi:molybdenum cofactor sulfurtransferase
MRRPQIPAASLLDASAKHLKQNLYGNPHSASSHASAEHPKRNLYGNLHSASSPSALAGDQVDLVRIRVLEFFKADPHDFALVFVANATAAIKLVGECFHDCALSQKKAFWYGYHNDAHTSLVGVREYSDVSRCFKGDEDVDTWIKEGGMDGHRHESGNGSGSESGHGDGYGNGHSPARLGLFAYPGQSNMNGRRLPVGPAGW